MTITTNWLKLNNMDQHFTILLSGPMMISCLAIYVSKISNKLVNKRKGESPYG